MHNGMSRSLSSRLQDLENEIHEMLKIPASGYKVKENTSSEVTAPTEVTVESMSYEASSSQIKYNRRNDISRKRCSSPVDKGESCEICNSVEESVEKPAKENTCFYDSKKNIFICAPPKVMLIEGPKTSTVLSDIPVNKEGTSIRASAARLKQSGEIIIEQLRSELEQKIFALGRAEEEKQRVLEMTHDLQDKYEKLRLSRSSEINEKNRKVRTLTKKVEKIEVEAVKSAKRVKKHSSKLNQAVRERDEQLKDLTNTTALIVENFKEKESQCAMLSNSQKELYFNYSQIQRENQNLKDTNEILVQNLKNAHDNLKNERKEYQSLLERVEKRCENNEDVSKLEELEKTLVEAKKREQTYIDESAMLELKLQKVRNEQTIAANQAEEEINKALQEKNRLSFKLEQFEEKFAITERQYQNKIKSVQDECKKISQNISAKLNVILQENQDLRGRLDVINETNMISYQKDMQELVDQIEQQTIIMKTQEEVINNKDQQLKSCHEDNTHLKGTIKQLQVQVDLLQQTFDAFEDTNDELEQQLEELKVQLDEERKQLKLKEKIISLQNEEIVNLKTGISDRDQKIDLTTVESENLSQETRKIADEMKSISAALTREIEEKQQQSLDYPTAQDVEEKIMKLEAARVALEKMCRNAAPAGDDEASKCSYLIRLVSSLERKVTLMKREMVLRTQLLTRQKERALDAAQFVTQKLSETVADFQAQVQVHRKMRSVLTRMLTSDGSRKNLLSKVNFDNERLSIGESSNKFSMMEGYGGRPDDLDSETTMSCYEETIETDTEYAA